MFNPSYYILQHSPWIYLIFIIIFLKITISEHTSRLLEDASRLGPYRTELLSSRVHQSTASGQRSTVLLHRSTASSDWSTGTKQEWIQNSRHHQPTVDPLLVNCWSHQLTGLQLAVNWWPLNLVFLRFLSPTVNRCLHGSRLLTPDISI